MDDGQRLAIDIKGLEVKLDYIEKNNHKLFKAFDNLNVVSAKLDSLLISMKKMNDHMDSENHRKIVFVDTEIYLRSNEGKAILVESVSHLFNNKEVIFYRWILALLSGSALGVWIKTFLGT